MKKVIQPYLLRAISSNALRDGRRKFHRLLRRLTNRKACINVYLKVDDPYSYLLVQALPSIEKRFNVEFSANVIYSLQEDMFPEPELWAKHALVDANYVASLYHFKFLPHPNKSQSAIDVAHYDAHAIHLQDRIDQGDNWQALLRIFEDYWQSRNANEPYRQMKQSKNADALKIKLKENSNSLSQQGHYLPATLNFEGEWYWGVDRLCHLEERLLHENLGKLPTVHAVFDRSYLNIQSSIIHNAALPSVNVENVPPIELFWSARSPYSYIALYKAIYLANAYGVPLNVKPVLPMMMRGLDVPKKKALYIFLDTTREARKLGIEYGFVADPLGPGVERCYSLLRFARERGRYLEYLLAFAQGVNAKGIRADTNEGMKRIVEQAGLNWSEAKCHLSDSHWKEEVVSNQQEMYAFGNWGVPIFRYKNTMVWGQDRMFVIERELQDAMKTSPVSIHQLD